jgi:hypothetical protein
MTNFRDLPYDWKAVVAALTGIAIFIFMGACMISDCNDCDNRQGVLVRNAWGWYSCVEAR